MHGWRAVAGVVRRGIAGRAASVPIVSLHPIWISAVAAARNTGIAGNTRAQWRAIEHAATAELERRTTAAQLRILQLLERHAADFSPRQRAALRRALGAPASARGPRLGAGKR